MKALFILPAAAVIAACAAAPEKIAPVTMSTSAYSGASCTAVGSERRAANTRLAALYEEQRKARNDDTVAVIILGIPAASLAGQDRASEIASLKGQVAAMEARLAGC